MKVLLVSPTYNSPARGNTITVERWQNGLKNNGFSVKVIGPKSLPESLDSWRPDIIHAHHAVHSGCPSLPWSEKLDIPLVVSLSGTDLNSKENGSPNSTCLGVLAKAAAIIAPFAENYKSLPTTIPPEAFHVVRRGVACKQIESSSQKKDSLEALLVGGLRPVKGQLKALKLVHQLRTKGLPVRLTCIGPTVDKPYAQKVFDVLSKSPYDTYRPAVSHSEMMHIYQNADVLFNCSDNEGSSNAILEALSFGVPVAATAVPGNRELLASMPGKIALLIDEDLELKVLFEWLAGIHRSSEEDDKERSLLAQKYVEEHHCMADEIKELVSVYRGLVTSA